MLSVPYVMASALSTIETIIDLPERFILFNALPGMFNAQSRMAFAFLCSTGTPLTVLGHGKVNIMCNAPAGDMF